MTSPGFSNFPKYQRFQPRIAGLCISSKMPRKTRYEIEKAFSYDEGSRSYQRTLLTSLLVVVISLAAVIYYLFSVTQVNGMPVPLERSDKLQDVLSKGDKIPLEAHIMSKCPDAKDCLRDLVLPAMQQVSDKVDFTLSYIGTYAHHYHLPLYLVCVC